MTVFKAGYLSEYQKFTDKTAQYPQGMVYVTLGLVGELGELQSKMVSIEDPQDLTEEETIGLMHEAGDVFWYIARSCQELGLQFGLVFGHAMTGGFSPKRNEETGDVEFQGFGCKDAWSDVCALAEKTKKLVRDGRSIDHEVALTALISAARIAAATCMKIDVNPMECIAANMEKLSSRLERGVIKGDGDNR